MTKAVTWFPIVMSFAAIALLSACGGGGGSGVTSYQISATAGTGGTISPANATVNAGGTTTLTVTANSGYAINGVTGCGGTLSGNTYTTGTIKADCTVTASFIAQYIVTATAGADGTISPASATVNAGGTTMFTVTPKRGYVVSGVSGCGGSLAGTTYTTGTTSAACTVTASFAAAFTWVSGSNTTDAKGAYGIQGVPAATNVPGSRDAGVAWTDASGNLWLFGGFTGYAGSLDMTVGNFTNELWKYSPSSGQWTWVGGSNTDCPQGVYGLQGVASTTNVPGARVATMNWMDASGNVWLYGGAGCDSGAGGTFIMYDDFWKFSPSSGEWTWIGGSTTSYLRPVYGTEGVAAATNSPGARNDAATWMDANGNMFMFGGEGGDLSNGSIGSAFHNDIWEYLPSSNEWAWIGGPNTVDGKGVYGVKGVADSANTPGARIGEVFWTDAQGNLWLFGGYGYDSTGVQRAQLNDLWKYSPSTGKWTWASGSNTANATGVYGTQGVAAAANVPGARNPAASWTDANGNLWLLGGEELDIPTGYYHRRNDLWKYSPSSGLWTWVAGPSTFDATGVYGTQGVAVAANVPGARAAASTWKGADGIVWLFGGYQYDDPTNTRFEMNDLWMYPTQ